MKFQVAHVVRTKANQRCYHAVESTRVDGYSAIVRQTNLDSTERVSTQV